ncbi:MAG TPA: CheR family methyltransferase, partial [Oscillospiraceae bacterium]|nr:CheR family methyltransferase [Oscillospiraceae bacterium]
MIFTLKIGDSDFERLVNFVQTNYGINLARKRTLIEGRLSNVLAEKGYSDYNSFLNWILNDKSGNELITLINKLTTNHTYFMREPEHFEYLRKEVLPYFEQNNKDREIRIWSAG